MWFNIANTSPINQLEVIDNFLIFVFPVVFGFLLLALYKQIFWLSKLTFRSVDDYKFSIDNLNDFYKHWIKLQLLLLLVFVIFQLKLLRRALDLIEIKHIAETLYYFETQLPIILAICGIPILFLLLILARLAFLYVLYSIKMLFLRLHLYFLQIPRYRLCGLKFICFPTRFSGFFIIRLMKIKKKPVLSMVGKIEHLLSLFESTCYKLTVMFAYFFDYITNFGFGYLSVVILPYYFLYNLSRKCVITWYNWFEDEDYSRASESLYENYENPDITNVIRFFHKVNSILWSQVVLLMFFFMYFGIVFIVIKVILLLTYLQIFIIYFKLLFVVLLQKAKISICFFLLLTLKKYNFRLIRNFKVRRKQ